MKTIENQSISRHGDDERDNLATDIYESAAAFTPTAARATSQSAKSPAAHRPLPLRATT